MQVTRATGLVCLLAVCLREAGLQNWGSLQFCAVLVSPLNLDSFSFHVACVPKISDTWRPLLERCFSLSLGCSCLQDFYSSVLDILTPDDVRILVETEDEYSRRGQFERVFPSHISMRYLRFFEQPRYFNILVTQWELKYYLNRHKGNCPPKAWHSHLTQAGCLPAIVGDF